MQTRVVPVFALFCAVFASRISCGAVACIPGFTTLPTFEVGVNLGTNALADLDGDGNLDLLTGNAYFLGDGKGGFLERTEIQGLPDMVFDVAARDLDRDGVLDLILLRGTGDEVLVVFGGAVEEAGAYPFGDPIALSTVEGAWHIACIDIDEDGFDDLVVAGCGSGEIALHRNNGDRTFRPCVELEPSTSMVMYAPAVSDFDGDGHADVAVAGDHKATVWFGDGAGGLRETAVVTTATLTGDVVYLHRLCAADLDGDGRAEVLGIGVTSNPAGPGFLLGYWGNEISPAAGLPARPSFTFEIPGGGRFLRVADANRDGLLDVITQGERMDRAHNFIKLFNGIRESDYTLEPAPEFETALSGHGSVLAIGDVNNDGNQDIVLTSEDSGRGEVSLNDGRCVPDEAARGDVNADSRLDIADAVTILSHLFARGFLPCRPAADTNSDDRLDLADAIYLLQHLFASGPPPASGVVACRP